MTIPPLTAAYCPPWPFGCGLRGVHSSPDDCIKALKKALREYGSVEEEVVKTKEIVVPQEPRILVRRLYTKSPKMYCVTVFRSFTLQEALDWVALRNKRNSYFIDRLYQPSVIMKLADYKRLRDVSIA